MRIAIPTEGQPSPHQYDRNLYSTSPTDRTAIDRHSSLFPLHLYASNVLLPSAPMCLKLIDITQGSGPYISELWAELTHAEAVHPMIEVLWRSPGAEGQLSLLQLTTDSSRQGTPAMKTEPDTCYIDHCHFVLCELLRRPLASKCTFYGS